MQRCVNFLLVFAFIGCSPAATPTPIPPTPDLKATETRIAANIFATQTAIAPTATRTFAPTNSPIPSVTSTVARTPTRGTLKSDDVGDD
jgi:hypothetical protein